MKDILISAKTRVCGVIGDPIEHSMSPVMHNAAFREMGIDCVYVAFRVKREELGQAIGGMMALNIIGLNVTIPHKVAVMQFLDKIDPLAEKIGAVNTIVNKDGRLTGYNTDGAGFLQTLVEKGTDPAEKNVVILGAGGASRAISFTLADRGARLVILNRREEFAWAEELAGKISQFFGGEVNALELNRANLAKTMRKADILVNATSVGMNPEVNQTPIDADLLRPGLVIFDVVYNPLKTRLSREAEAAGAKVISGIDMLVWQGALAFEKWTGRKPPVELMKKEAIKLLENHEN